LKVFCFFLGFAKSFIFYIAKKKEKDLCKKQRYDRIMESFLLPFFYEKHTNRVKSSKHSQYNASANMGQKNIQSRRKHSTQRRERATTEPTPGVLFTIRVQKNKQISEKHRKDLH
jgi:hypothetical protein